MTREPAWSGLGHFTFVALTLGTVSRLASQPDGLAQRYARGGPELGRDAAIAVILGGGLLLARVPLRWILVILAAAAVVTYGVDAFFDELSDDG